MSKSTRGHGGLTIQLGFLLVGLSWSIADGKAAPVDGFDYPFGPPEGTPRCPGTAQCAGGWQNVQDFRVNNHLGEDWNFGFGEDDLGKPVYAVANGVVTYAQDVGGDGSWKGVIIIQHTGSDLKVPGRTTVSQVSSMYAHLDVAKINNWVPTGSIVSRGQQIGVIGPTPVGSTGPHLHFEIRTDPAIGVGPGYSANATGWIDPSDFIDANRTFSPSSAKSNIEQSEPTQALQLVMTASPNPVRPGETVNYVMTVVNRGSTSLSGVKLRQVMPDYMARFYANTCCGGGPWAWESWANDGDDYVEAGESVTWNLGTLAAGQSRSVVFAATIVSGSAAPANNTVISSSAEVSESGGGGVSASASVMAHSNPPLVLAMQADRNPVRPGETLTYTLSYGNPSAVNVSGVVLRAAVPDGTTFSSASNGGVKSGSEIKWDLGQLSAGAGGQCSFVVTVNSGLGSGTVIAGHGEIGAGAGRADTVTVVQSNPVLGLSMTASPDLVRPGEQINYVMKVVNQGSTSVNEVKLRQLMPAYMVRFYADTCCSGPWPWESWADDGDDYVEAGESVTWNLGTLAAGQSRSVTMSIRVSPVTVTSSDPRDGSFIPSAADVFATNTTGIAGVAIQAAVRVGANWPFILPVADQEIAEAKLLTFAVRAVDANQPNEALTFSLEAGTPLGATINPQTGVFSWTPTRAQGPSTNSISVRVTDSSPQRLSHTRTFTVVVVESNDPPVITTIANQTVNEGSLLTFKVTVVDADLPQQTLTFNLEAGAPSGAQLDATTGVFAWTPTEAQGPDVYPITVRVTDSGQPPLSATQTFTVTVNEVNTPPALAPTDDRTINEGTALTIPFQATDSDLPAQKLTYSLEQGAPAGAAIDPVTGLFNWTPSEEQGPSTNRITVRVTDNGPQNLSDTKTFTVVVNEVNSVPVLPPIAEKIVNEKTKLEFKVEATDTDFPKNTLTFNLDSDAPPGMTIDAASGIVTWAVGEVLVAQTNTVTVSVTDSGSPALAVTNSFRVVSMPSTLRLAPIQNFIVDEGSLVTFTAAPTNSPLAKPPLTYSLESGAPTGATISTAGAFFWRPSEAQGPSTNVISVRVTDSSLPPVSATQSFTVVVREVNRAPVLAAVARQTNVVGRTLTIQLSATDEDLPANTLSYSLEPGAPTGATIDPVTGVFTWTPGPASVSSTNSIAVRVTDNGSPILSGTSAFVVVVVPPGELKLSPSLLSSGQFQITLLNTEPGRTYFIEASANLRDWDLLTNVVSAATRVEFTDSASLGVKQRFYRAVSP
ncbi:MAG: DUF11 domain-containing protein [Verrucomicrobia bacterium]|nr:DUF11 domain-containing protein [Verrucomicrobiota bacterium]